MYGLHVVLRLLIFYPHKSLSFEPPNPKGFNFISTIKKKNGVICVAELRFCFHKVEDVKEVERGSDNGTYI